jgi:signal transduction histidine kinase
MHLYSADMAQAVSGYEVPPLCLPDCKGTYIRKLTSMSTIHCNTTGIIFKEISEIARGLKTCGLCWRVTFLLFVSILTIEAILLVFSANQFEKARLAEAEREALVTARTIIRASLIIDDMHSLDNTLTDSAISYSAFEEIGPILRKNSLLSGAVVFDESGMPSASFGDRPTITPFDEKDSRLSIDGTMDILWKPKRMDGSRFVAGRVDVTHIPEMVQAHVLKIVGLVLLISLSLTLTSMIILERVLLRPIRCVNTVLSDIARNPGNTSEDALFVKMGKRQVDEWVDVRKNLIFLTRCLRQAFLDIKEQQDQLAEAEKIKKISDAKSDFLANMSHDLRTPLNAIIGYSETINMEIFGPVGSERYREYIQDILESASQLKFLVDDLLDLGRIEAGTFELDEQWDNLLDTVRRAVFKCESTYSGVPAKTIQMHTGNVNPGLEIFADQKAMNRILTNLVGNSLDHAGPTAKTRVVIFGTSEGRFYIEIGDNGCGIDQDVVARITEAYFQAGPNIGRSAYSKRKSTGFGLGLTMTASLLRHHEMGFVIESIKGSGTVCRVEIPLSRTRQTLVSEAFN